MRVEFLFSFFNIKYGFFILGKFFKIFPLRHSDMFYMPFDSSHQDESNGTSFIKNRYLNNKLSVKIFSNFGK